MSSEQLPTKSPLAGTGLEHIHDELVILKQNLDTTKSDLEQLEQSRYDAVTYAATPYEAPIYEARGTIVKLQKEMSLSKVVSELKDSGLDPLSKTALDIILRYHNTSLEEFAEGIKHISQNNNFALAAKTRRQLAEFKGFKALCHDLKNSEDGGLDGKPIGLFTIDWAEEYDTQAEWEGRASGTGVYKKMIEATLGKVTFDDLLIVNENISPDDALLPIMHPKAIVLGLSKALRIQTRINWGAVESDIVEDEDSQTLTILSATSNKEMAWHKPLPIDWKRSDRMDFSLMREITNNQTTRSSKLRFIVWGDRLLKAIDSLAQDNSVTNSTGSTLLKAKQEITNL